jgi:hypothetical protein
MTFLDGRFDLPFATFHLPNPAPRITTALSPASPAASAIRTTASSAYVGSSSSSSSPREASSVSIVAQALEIARDSAEGAGSPTVSATLETALAAIWRRIQARPASYVMTRDEFAVFNYFQHRFQGDRLAIAARKRYWDHLRVSDREQEEAG